MNAKILALAIWVWAAGAISSRAVVTEIVYRGYNFLTCQVAGGTANTVFDFSSFPALASDPNGVDNWRLYLWYGNAYAGPVYYFSAADASTYWGQPAAGWYDLTGNYVGWPLNPGEGFLIFALNTGPNGSAINLSGAAAVPPPSAYTPWQFDLRGRPDYSYGWNLPPATEWAAISSSAPLDGVAMYIWNRGKVFNPNTTPLSPQGWTVFYFHGGWVPSGQFDTIYDSNQSVLVGLCPKVVEGTVYNDSGSCSGSGLANWTVELIYSNTVSGTFTGIATNYGISDSVGDYSVIVPADFLSPGGTVTLAAQKKDPAYWTQSTCAGYPFYTPPNPFAGQFSTGNDFYEQALSPNQHVSVDLVCFSPYPYCTPCCGGTMTYEITYLNDGNANVNGAALALYLPAGVARNGMGQISVSDSTKVKPASVGTPGGAAVDLDNQRQPGRFILHPRSGRRGRCGLHFGAEPQRPGGCHRRAEQLAGGLFGADDLPAGSELSARDAPGLRGGRADSNRTGVNLLHRISEHECISGL